eukprot:Opistho-1_new@62939
MDHRACLDAHVGNDAVRADAHAFAQRHRAFEHAVDVDVDVGAAAQRAAQVETRRVGQAHALFHQRVGLAQLPGALQRRELGRAVDAGHLQRVGHDMRHHRHAVVGRELHDVGQVVLALGVLVVQARQPALEQPRGRGHHAAVDLAHGALRLGGVLVLDDGRHLAPGMGADDAAIARGVVEFDGQQREPFAAAGGDEGAQRVLGDERHVARQDHHGAIVRQLRRGLLHGMAGAQLGLLARETEGGGVHGRGLDRGFGLLGAVARHDHDMARADARGGVGHVGQQGAAGQTMQHFGQLALHARALAGRHDDDVDRSLVALLRSLIHALFFPDSLCWTGPNYRCAAAGRCPGGLQRGQARLQQPARAELLVARRLLRLRRRPDPEGARRTRPAAGLAPPERAAAHHRPAAGGPGPGERRGDAGPGLPAGRPRPRAPARRHRARRGRQRRTRAEPERGPAAAARTQVREEQHRLPQGLARSQPRAGARKALRPVPRASGRLLRPPHDRAARAAAPAGGAVGVQPEAGVRGAAPAPAGGAGAAARLPGRQRRPARFAGRGPRRAACLHPAHRRSAARPLARPAAGAAAGRLPQPGGAAQHHQRYAARAGGAAVAGLPGRPAAAGGGALRQAASSDHRHRPQRALEVVAQRFERMRLQDAQPAAIELVQAQALQAPHRLVGVHQRQPQRVGNVLLVERKLHPAVAHHAHALGATVQVHEQHGHALAGVAAPGGDEVVVHQLFLARGQPGDVVAEPGLGLEQRPQPLAREGAQRGVGHGLDAVGLAVGKLVLQADEVAGQQETQDLPPAVAQGLVAEGPACVEREQLRAGAVLVDDGAARLDTPGAGAKGLDRLQLLRRHRQEGLQAPQRAVFAGVCTLRRGGSNGVVLELHAAL